jgi:hypothetical protein
VSDGGRRGYAAPVVTRTANSQARPKAVWELESPLRGLARSLLGLLGRDPDFLVLGAQRAGTTSLHRWLDTHPEVRMADPKEVHYFDLQHERGRSWYRSHFPRRDRRLAGEVTPYYLYHPAVPARAREALPRARFVVSLRDPVARAHSQFRHERELGFEPVEDFAEALALEEGRLRSTPPAEGGEPRIDSYAHNHHSYFDRGRYAVQLERWFACFPRERFHVLFSEELFEDPQRTLGELAGFLGIEFDSGGSFERSNAAEGAALDAGLKRELESRYEADDAALEALLGRRLPWRRG